MYNKNATRPAKFHFNHSDFYYSRKL